MRSKCGLTNETQVKVCDAPGDGLKEGGEVPQMLVIRQINRGRTVESDE